MTNNKKRSQDSLDSIGNRIRAVRGFSSLSRRDFGRKHKISDATLKSWELAITSIRNTSLKRLLKALNDEEIICSAEWIKEGRGTPPYKLETAPSDKQKSNVLGNKSGILPEVTFFLKNNDEAIVFQIPDEGMLPFYEPEDYVGGILVQETRQFKNHRPYLVTLKTGEKEVKMLFYENNQYISSKTNPLYQRDQSILKEKELLSLHEIVWHRKYKSNNRVG